MNFVSAPARAFVLSAFFIVAGFGLAACNTVSGFGQDMQTLGQAMTKSSGKAQSSQQTDPAPQANRDREPPTSPGSEPDYNKPAPSNPKTLEPNGKY